MSPLSGLERVSVRRPAPCWSHRRCWSMAAALEDPRGAGGGRQGVASQLARGPRKEAAGSWEATGDRGQPEAGFVPICLPATSACASRVTSVLLFRGPAPWPFLPPRARCCSPLPEVLASCHLSARERAERAPPAPPLPPEESRPSGVLVFPTAATLGHPPSARAGLPLPLSSSPP